MGVGMNQASDWNWDRDFSDPISVQYQERDQSVKFAASAFDAARRLPREEESAATLLASSEPTNDHRPEKCWAFRRR